MNREPALIRTAIVTVIAQVLSLGVTLGLLHLDGGQVAAINTAVALVSAAVAALWVRSGVTPVADPDPSVVAVEKVHVVETPAITSAIAASTGEVPVSAPAAPVEEETPVNDYITPNAASRLSD